MLNVRPGMWEGFLSAPVSTSAGAVLQGLSPHFHKLHFRFHSIKVLFVFLSDFLFWLMDYLEVKFHIFAFLSHIFLLLKSSLIVLWSENILCKKKKIKFYVFEMRLILIQYMVLLWWRFHVLLKRRDILLFGGMFCKCYLDQIYWRCSSLLEPYWFSVYLFCCWESSIKSL